MDKPRSEAQIAVSRANGALSRGPVTGEGKAISSRNAITHGLLSTQALLPGEEKEQFDQIFNAAVLKYRPEDEDELFIITQFAMHQWRQLRIWAIQVAGLAGEIRRQTEDAPEIPKTDMAWRAWVVMRDLHPDRHAMQLLHRYEVSAENRFDRKWNQLMGLKERREGTSGNR